MRIFILVIILSLFNNALGQRLSTLFIDEALVIVNNDTIVNSSVKTKRYLLTDLSHTLTIYQDTKYKLKLCFVKANTLNDPWLLHSNFNLFRNDTSLALSENCNYCDSTEECCYLFREERTLQNWSDNSVPKSITFARLTYRLFNMSPEDTSTYNCHDRNGKWVGVDCGNKYYVNYKNDVKDGEAKLLFGDNAYYSQRFTNGLATSEPEYAFPNTKSKFRRRQLPVVFNGDCTRPIRP